jgi:RNA polymerase sigma-70 factor, ECF subfamily
VIRALHHPTLAPKPDALADALWYPQAVGDEKVTFSRAALEHLDALYRVARNLTGRDSDAEDLVQETYTRAIAARAQFTEGTNPRAWLFRILRNAHIDACRRAKVNPVALGLEDELAADMTSSPREPHRIVMADIEAALASLSIDARTIILLDLEGFTEAELAETLGCAAGTVKSRLARARAILREQLRDYGS